MNEDWQDLTAEEMTNLETEYPFWVGVLAVRSLLPPTCQALMENLAEDQALVHLSGYKTHPTQDDLDALEKELRDDPDFGLVGYAGKFIFFVQNDTVQQEPENE